MHLNSVVSPHFGSFLGVSRVNVPGLNWGQKKAFRDRADFGPPRVVYSRTCVFSASWKNRYVRKKWVFSCRAPQKAPCLARLQQLGAPRKGRFSGTVAFFTKKSHFLVVKSPAERRDQGVPIRVIFAVKFTPPESYIAVHVSQNTQKIPKSGIFWQRVGFSSRIKN